MHNMNERSEEPNNGNPGYLGPMEIKIGQRSVSNGPSDSQRIKKALADKKNLLRSVLLKNSLQSISQSRVVSRECKGLKRSTLQLIALQAQVLTSINSQENEEKLDENIKQVDQHANKKPPICRVRKISNANTNTSTTSNQSPTIACKPKKFINIKLNPSRKASNECLIPSLIPNNEKSEGLLRVPEISASQSSKAIASSPALKNSNKYFWTMPKELPSKKPKTMEGKCGESKRPHIYRMKKLTLPPINATESDKLSLRKPIKFMSIKVSSDTVEIFKTFQMQNRSNSISNYFI